MLARRLLAIASVAVVAIGCSGSGDSSTGDSGSNGDVLVADIRAAAEAVEAELGGPQQFFEITSTAQLTNVFVAIDDQSAAVPYVYLDGVLQPPAPVIEGAQGQTFSIDVVDFDEATMLDGIRADLPTASLVAFSVEGGPNGSVRYLVSAQSSQGGALDIVLAPSGAVVEVNPI